MPLKHDPAHAGLNFTKINNLVGFCVPALLDNLLYNRMNMKKVYPTG